ncbi:MAG: hypothetical protein OXF74_08890 [Rhodobacteraceae bacterium]|nr:hypothetical protein [Paracoccaceae bacterium]
MADRNSGHIQDPFTNLFVVILVLAAASAAIGQLSDEILGLTAFAALVMLWPFAALVETHPLLLGIPVLGAWLLAPAAGWWEAIPLVPIPTINMADWQELQLAAGRIACIISAPFLLPAIFRLRRRRPDITYRRKFSLDALINAQALSWPLAGSAMHLEPLARRVDPVDRMSAAVCESKKGDAGTGKLLLSALPPLSIPDEEIVLRPEIWLAGQNLAHRTGKPGSQTISDRKDRIRIPDGLTADAVTEVMEEQLGPLWRGFASLRPALKGLAAAFALCLTDRPTACWPLLERLSLLSQRAKRCRMKLDACIQQDRKTARQVEAVLNGEAGRKLQQAADLHAWQRTAFIEMLLAARKGTGVLASASFVWLKSEDRLLWLALNSAGCRISPAETAGIAAHFLAEQQARQPLTKPTIHQAGLSLVRDYLDLCPERARILRERTEALKPIGQRLREAAPGAGAGC